jgi:hypothetical protein
MVAMPSGLDQPQPQPKGSIVTTQTTELTATGTPDDIVRARTAASSSLPTYRLNMMRIGYLFMAVGLVLVKWPLIINGTVATLPVYEGVVAVLLTAMSLLAFLGLRYPVAMLPVLMFEVGWKLIWMAVVGIPNLAAGDTNALFTSVFFNVCFGVVVLVVTPWDYAWKRFVRAPGDPWR